MFSDTFRKQKPSSSSLSSSPPSSSSSSPPSPSPEWPWVGIGSQGCMHLRLSSQIASPTRSRTYCTLGLEAMNYYYGLLQDEKGFATDFEVLSNFCWYFHGNCHLNFSSLSRRGFFLDSTSFLIWNSFPFPLKLTVADKTPFSIYYPLKGNLIYHLKIVRNNSWSLNCHFITLLSHSK